MSTPARSISASEYLRGRFSSGIYLRLLSFWMPSFWREAVLRFVRHDPVYLVALRVFYFKRNTSALLYFTRGPGSSSSGNNVA